MSRMERSWKWIDLRMECDVKGEESPSVFRLEKCDDDVDAFRSLDDREVIRGVIRAGFSNRLVRVFSSIVMHLVNSFS
jgi:hypothetical protein